MPSGSAVFLDTTIQIARFVHSPEIKARIERRVRSFDVSVTGLVVRQEFKRRLLKEAEYLLRQLERLGSYRRLLRHVTDVLPPPQARKRNICLEILETLFEKEDDVDLTDRTRLFLRSMIKGGLREFDELVDRVIPDSGCACGARPIREVGRHPRFDFGTDKCSQTGSCGIVAFLGQREPQMRAILCLLESLSSDEKTDELRVAENLIRQYFTDPAGVVQLEPCLRAGDLVIALESIPVPVVYTMNARESRHLCRALDQQLVVRPRNPDHDDLVCPRGASNGA